MRVTIKSIAEAANVSRGTVDRVLNNRNGVSEISKAKVLKIAKEMGYKTNIAGKALAFQSKPIKIGVIIPSIRDQLFYRVFTGVKQATQEFGGFGIKVNYIVMKGTDWQEQLSCIEMLENTNIEALVLSPFDTQEIKDKINKLSEKIKIVTYNTEIDGISRFFYVGQNTIKGGRVGGELLGKLLPNGGNVLLISGPDRFKGLVNRAKGFEETTECNYPQLKIIKKIKVDGTNQSAYYKTKEMLSKDLNIHAIYLTGRGIEGVGKAMIELGKQKIRFICHDKLPETVDFLEKGIVDFTITQEPVMQGYLPIKILFEYYLHNKTPNSDLVYTDLKIVTKENIVEK